MKVINYTSASFFKETVNGMIIPVISGRYVGKSREVTHHLSINVKGEISINIRRANIKKEIKFMIDDMEKVKKVYDSSLLGGFKIEFKSILHHVLTYFLGANYRSKKQKEIGIFSKVFDSLELILQYFIKDLQKSERSMLINRSIQDAYNTLKFNSNAKNVLLNLIDRFLAYQPDLNQDPESTIKGKVHYIKPFLLGEIMDQIPSAHENMLPLMYECCKKLIVHGANPNKYVDDVLEEFEKRNFLKEDNNKECEEFKKFISENKYRYAPVKTLRTITIKFLNNPSESSKINQSDMKMIRQRKLLFTTRKNSAELNYWPYPQLIKKSK